MKHRGGIVPFDYVKATVQEMLVEGRDYTTVRELIKRMQLDGGEPSNYVSTGIALNKLGCVWRSVKVAGIPVRIWKIKPSPEGFCNKTARAELNLHTLNTIPPTGGAL